MIPEYKMFYLYFLGVILLIVAIIQAINRNSLAFVPFVCSIYAFVRAWRMEK